LKLVNPLESAHKFVNSIEIHRKFFRTSFMKDSHLFSSIKFLLHGNSLSIPAHVNFTRLSDLLTLCLSEAYISKCKLS
jgi:hypothetical protein